MALISLKARNGIRTRLRGGGGTICFGDPGQSDHQREAQMSRSMSRLALTAAVSLLSGAFAAGAAKGDTLTFDENGGFQQ
jgi:hypothetical protein